MAKFIQNNLRNFLVILIIFSLAISWIFLTPDINVQANPAEYLNNPSFDGGTTGWTLTTTAYDDTYYQDTAGSIETSCVERNCKSTGDAEQTIGTDINSTDTVLLSLYWSKRSVVLDCKANNIRVEIEKPTTPGVWDVIWSDITIPAFNGATEWTPVSSEDVSSYFTDTGTYNIRFYADVRGGVLASNECLAWFDNTSLDVTAAANETPTLTVSQPDGVDDTVTVGQSYNITYTLSDTDDDVTAAFYYDTNNTGLDGIAITGPCATAAEGTNVTCAWDTTEMTPGDYYVYGITNDGVNPDVSDYSPGQITIQAVSISITITTDGDVAYGIVGEGNSQDTTASGVDDTQTVKNNGNVAEKISIKTSNAIGGTDWTVGSTAGTDIFVHSFATTTAETWQILDVVGTYEIASSSVAVNGTLDFDLKITVPTASTDDVEKTVTVTFLAEQAQ
ncbi:MAG: hypothetical protein IB617_01905 [Candidatus Nealsonbacteria bacterium]|nr:MAG: hypothetical protein IB617_01905 [Candidatus Nealsonbacteria bacterium]